MGLEELIDETINALEELKNKIREESIDWWWLDQGNAPLISINKVVVTDRGVNKEKMPKISLKSAITTILENLKAAQMSTRKIKTEVYNIIMEDVKKLTELYEKIKEAHEIIKELDRILSSIEALEESEKKIKLKKIAKGTINWIKEIITREPWAWEEKKQMFKNVVEKLYKDIS